MRSMVEGSVEGVQNGPIGWSAPPVFATDPSVSPPGCHLPVPGRNAMGL